MGTKISWTDETWQPVVGCTKISDGCKFCYAEKMAIRLARIEQARKYKKRKYHHVVELYKKPPRWRKNTYCDKAALDKPTHWKNPRRIFVCSMGDLFHESVPDGFIIDVFDVAAQAAAMGHTLQFLTKRPQRLFELVTNYINWIKDEPNIWLGVTAENQKLLWERGLILAEIAAAKRFISFEPLLSEISLGEVQICDGIWLHEYIDWVIIGCESGSKRRPCKIEWVKDLVNQCKAAGVAVFVKQLDINGKVVKDITKFPKDLQYQEYPE